ncbi:hypothetical protein HYFRA_00008875 [Hymenoscyphus fraxineus]|uniref:NAD-dependent epimerase/dehydratase domain-containing protein n=1 Tax=Hymenoscyphus fraxineus TaxID=746836 RepID=A0A9N9KYW1_9HELO|nr:hypothetical protein HYFRA_00008875 [Hymenoscyphus fraxineus]
MAKQDLITAATARSMLAGHPVVMVTGGCGYIGSHTVLELLIAGWSVVVIDNLCNSNIEALRRVYFLAREYFLACLPQEKDNATDRYPQLHFIKADIRNRSEMAAVLGAYNTELPSRLEITHILTSRHSYRKASMAFQTQPTAMTLKASLDKSDSGKISHVIHFAALKAVGESAVIPLEYYQTNVGGLLNILSVLDEFHVRNIVFSSSAVVYGSGNGNYISEDSVRTAGRGAGGGLLTNPYGRTKWMDEEILDDWCMANTNVQAIALRYFNPTGCHPSGLIGEDPNGVPSNLMPVVLQTYQRRRSKVAVFGSDYNTKDGSGVRDFIHVVDLAKGHVAALNKLVSSPPIPSDANQGLVDDAANYHVYNLGTGTGYSVLEIITAFAIETGVEIPFVQGDRRPGDLGSVTANPSKAFTELGWKATHGLEEMCKDLVKWANKNPTGYERLRQMSVIAATDQEGFMTKVRKASVARRQSMAPVWHGEQIPDLVGGGEEESEDLGSLVKSLVLDDEMFEKMVERKTGLFGQEFTYDFNSRRKAGGCESPDSPGTPAPNQIQGDYFGSRGG